MKRWGILLCLLLTLSLAACGGGNSAAQNTPAENTGAGSADPNVPAEPAGNAASGEAEAAEEAPTARPFSVFSTTDLEGNAVDQSILEGYDLTLVNVWATYCTPCLEEMPDLGSLAAEYEAKGVQVLGLVSDVLNSDGTVSDSQVELAQEIVEETGADYQHLVPSSDMFGLLSQIYGVPTTFFVDSEGYQVGYAYVSALSRDQFVTIIEDALAEVEQ